MQTACTTLFSASLAPFDMHLVGHHHTRCTSTCDQLSVQDAVGMSRGFAVCEHLSGNIVTVTHVVTTCRFCKPQVQPSRPLVC